MGEELGGGDSPSIRGVSINLDGQLVMPILHDWCLHRRTRIVKWPDPMSGAEETCKGLSWRTLNCIPLLSPCAGLLQLERWILLYS